jgi:carboxyl-terminal processing protease
VRAGRGLVVDLRGNRGGDLAAAVTLADAWLDGGVVYRRRTRDDAGTVSAMAGALLGGVPTILLVDRDTASAAEVLAGALADAGHATLVGERTFGKGAVQEVIAFETAPAA